MFDGRRSRWHDWRYRRGDFDRLNPVPVGRLGGETTVGSGGAGSGGTCGVNPGNSGSGNMSGIVGAPATGVALGVLPSIITVTPWGMLATRTIEAWCSGTTLAGTFINSPGSIM